MSITVIILSNDETSFCFRKRSSPAQKQGVRAGLGGEVLEICGLGSVLKVE